jgi:hypothetical protein
MTATRAPTKSRLWRLLMTPVGTRVPVRLRKDGKKGAPHGIALFMVLIALAFMSAIVTDFGYNELVRYKLAAHDRDSLKAQALAEGGVRMSRLLLRVQGALQPMITGLAEMGIPLPAHTIWDIVPLDSELLKGLISGELQSTFGLDVRQALQDRQEAHLQKMEDRRSDFDGGGREDGKIEPFEPPPGGFGAFDGNFVVQIEDEEKRAATLRGWAKELNTQKRFSYAQRLHAVFAPERYDFLFEERDAEGNLVDREELVANIFDFIDSNQDLTEPRATPDRWGMGGGGAEDALYTGYDEGVEPKNADLDSPGDLRRVHGWTDAHTRAFGDQISLYGNNKINLMSAPLQSVEALVRLCALDPLDYLLVDPQWMTETLQLWQTCKMLGVMAADQGCGKLNAEGFMQVLDIRGLKTNPQVCKENIDLGSMNFTVRVTANVGDTTRTTTLVARVPDGAGEVETYFYSVR